MKKYRFTGVLQSIEPSKLIDVHKSYQKDRLPAFFLMLSLVYNDLKSIGTFAAMIKDKYEMPGKNEKSVHAGEFSGNLVYLNRLYCATMFEFIKLFNTQEQKGTFSENTFEEILEAIPESEKKTWDMFKEIASNLKSNDDISITNSLEKIRHNAVFHYYQPKEMRKSFKTKFFDTAVSEEMKNDAAYFSLNIHKPEETRFFFAEAAAEEYLKEHIDSKNYRKDIVVLIDKLSSLIVHLMNVYIKKLKE